MTDTHTYASPTRRSIRLYLYIRTYTYTFTKRWKKKFVQFCAQLSWKIPALRGAVESKDLFLEGYFWDYLDKAS